MSLVSIIVPVYNSAPYLRRCIDSILCQTYSKIEVILINDGSTDKSGVICNEYGERYSNIQVIDKENGGVSSARNLGLSHIKGDWVYFCDSDDTLLEDTIQNLITRTKTDIDCVVGGYNELDINGGIKYTSSKTDYEISLDFKEGLLDIYCPKYLNYNGFLWNRLFRSDVIQSHNLRFREDIHYREDGLFIIEFLCASGKKLIYFSSPVYNYYKNPTGAMMTLGYDFPEKFITELDSRVLSNTIISKATGINSYKLRYKAKASIIEGYDWIISLMDNYSYHHIQQRSTLYKKTIESVSVPFYYFYRIYKRVRKLI